MSTVGTLKRMRASIEDAIKRVKRKRSWRPSEKAMAAASYMEDQAALDAAITALSGPQPKWEGQFNSFNDWLETSRHVLTGRKGSVGQDLPALCIDAKGRRCHVGKDFERAKNEDAFPIRYLWEFK